ncbi:MAG: hypothetical protein KUG75_04910 [Pseudomonadales bacterium]|nr:hypothetical protein [Pseudomonadales bacterium]
MNICIISNPNGRRVKRHLGLLIQSIGSLDGVEHWVTESDTDLGRLLSSSTWTADDLIVINGGDGTAQHIFTAFFNLGLDVSPRFALLPGGTTNMTANSYNFSHAYPAALSSLRNAIMDSSTMQIKSRCLVQVSNQDSSIYGAFFGTGLIVQGIQYCHDSVYKTGMRSEIGAGLALLRAVWGMVRRQPPFTQAVEVQIDDYPELPMLVLMVSSLDRLFLGMRPFWGREPGALHLTGIMQGAIKFLRRLFRIVRGGQAAADLSSAQGYVSRNLNRVSLSFDGPYTIDGELFDTRGRDLTVCASNYIEVLVL